MVSEVLVAVDDEALWVDYQIYPATPDNMVVLPWGMLSQHYPRKSFCILRCKSSRQNPLPPIKKKD